MILDGDIVKSLLETAESEALICAPFIKVEALRRITASMNEDVSLNIYTRWLVHEVALGVSDLEVFEVCEEHPKWRLYHVENVHAKCFKADNEVLVGSANVTNAALGWSRFPNIEIVAPIDQRHPSVQKLISSLKNAEIITREFKEKIEREAGILNLDDLKDCARHWEELKGEQEYWLPSCSVPQYLYKVYRQELSSRLITQSVIEDARNDLEDLSVPNGLSESGFGDYVRSVLFETPSFAMFIREIPGRLTEAKAKEILSKMRPSADEEARTLHWHNILQWFDIFLASKFEVAPVSFELRLK